MAELNYITNTDVTATVVQDFNISGYIDRSNDHCEYFARTLNVNPSGIANPIHPQTKEYLVAWCEREIYKDKMGTNNVDFDQDKYITLFNIQSKEVERLRRDITKEIMMSKTASGNETSSTVILYRA